MAELISKLTIPQSAATPIPAELRNLFGAAQLKGNDTEFLYFKNEMGAISEEDEYLFSMATIIIPEGFCHVDARIKNAALASPADIELSVGKPLKERFTATVLLHLRENAPVLVDDLKHNCAAGLVHVGGRICARLSTSSRLTGFLKDGYYYVLNDLHTDTFIYSFITNQGEDVFKAHMFNWFKTIQMTRETGEYLAVGVENELECYDGEEFFWASGVDLWLANFSARLRRNHAHQTLGNMPVPNATSVPPHMRVENT